MAAREDLARERRGLRGRVHAASAWRRPAARPPSARQPASTSRHTRTGAACPRRALARSARAARRSRPSRVTARPRRPRSPARAAPPVGGRVGDDDVLGAVRGQPQRLGQRERERAARSPRARGRAPAARGSAPTCSPAGSACPRRAVPCPPRWRHSASRSTSANGASSSAVARSSARRSSPSVEPSWQRRGARGRAEDALGPGVGEAALRVEPRAHRLEAVPLGVARAQRRGRLEVALAPVRAPVRARP